MGIINKYIKLTEFNVPLSQYLRVGSEWTMKWTKQLYQCQYHRLYLVKDGEGLVYTPDGETVLEKDTVLFFPAFSIKETVCDSYLEKYFIHFQANTDFNNVLEYSIKSRKLPASADSDTLFRTVYNNYAKNTAEAYFSVQGALRMILAPFLRETSYVGTEFTRFGEVLTYIENNLEKDITLKELADIANLNGVYFSNLFCKTLKLPPTQFIINKRLQKAQMLLHDSDLSAKEISYQCGFSSETYFFSLFKQRYGITPLAFRNESREATTLG